MMILRHLITLTFSFATFQVSSSPLSYEDTLESAASRETGIVLAQASPDNKDEPLDPLEELEDLPPAIPPDPGGCCGNPPRGGSIRASNQDNLQQSFDQMSEDQVLDLTHAAIVEQFGDQFVVTKLSGNNGTFLVVQDAPPTVTADTSNLFPKHPIREPSASDRLNRELRDPTPARESRFSEFKREIEQTVERFPVEVKTREYEDSRETYQYEIRIKKEFDKR